MKKYVVAGVLVLAVIIYIFFTNQNSDTTIVPNTPSASTGTLVPSESTNPATAMGGTSGTGASSSGAETPAAAAQFTVNLSVGSTGADVSSLQRVLINEGYLTAVPAPTGYFGSLTQVAMEKWQRANGISPATGLFGPKSRTLINGTAAAGTSGGTGTIPTTQGQYKDGTYTGPVVNALYGNIQVVATVEGGAITSIAVPIYPDSPGHSSQVAASAIPQLKQEALAAQSANVNVVSGATQDSQAFQQSLAAALATANN